MSTYQHIATFVNLPSSTYLPLPTLKYQYVIAADPGASSYLCLPTFVFLPTYFNLQTYLYLPISTYLSLPTYFNPPTNL